MFRHLVVLASSAVLAALTAPAVEHPAAEIANGEITAKLYLPDVDNGYYRGTRFDWSGVIYSLTYKGHEYFGEWQQSNDPYLHDRITGPVEEFRSNDGGLGYDEAKPGDLFIRIGIGACRKPEEKEYRWTHRYDVVNPGNWTIEKGGNWIQFTHELDAGNGYAYKYTKWVTLTPNKPELVISHKLENTGERVIVTDTYNHNFFVIDNQPTGPDFVVGFAFEPKAARDLQGIAELRGKELHYLTEVPRRRSVFSPLEGFGNTAEDNRFSIENRKVKAGVRIRGDKPLARVNYWSPNTTLCPEPYINLNVTPGSEESWTIRYEFYTID